MARVGVNPRLVAGAALTAGDVRDRLQAIADGARAAVSPGASAWGDDEFGAKFAEGDKGFVEGSGNMADGTDSLSSSFDNLADGLRTTSKKLTAMEHGNTDRFK